MVDNVESFEINKTNQTKALIDDGPLWQSLVALLQAEQRCLRSMPVVGTETQDK